MTKRIFETTLKAYQIRKPFKPFLVELVSGAILDISHPEGLISQGGAAVYIDPGGEITIFDAPGVVRIAHKKVSRVSA